MSSQQVEVEAAKFLHKLIQESKDEPAKLATKLFVICQHMKMSGKEHSLPYQVISRAMETVIDQHGLDINALKTSRLPPVGGLGEPSNRLKTCDRPESGGGSNFLVKDSSTGGYASSSSHRVEGASGASEIGKHDAAASDRPPVRPTRVDNVGQDNPQELISLTSCKSSDHGSPTTLPMEDSRSTNSQEDKDSKSNKQVARKITKRTPGKRKRADTRSIAESHNDDLQMTDVASSGFNTSKEKLPSKGDTQAPTDRGDNLILQTVRNEQMPSFAGTSQEIFQPFFERSLDKTNPNPLPPGSNIFGSTGVWVQNKFGKQLEARECSSSSGIVSSAANPPKIVMGQGGDNLETPAFSYQVTQDNAVTSGRRGLIDPRNQHYFTRPTSELKFTGNYGDAKNIVEMPNIPKDMGKSSKPHAAMLSNMPFKEQHLKQLRAQCLVFLAFRNNLVPRKLHLEIALGESYPQEGPGNGVKEAYQEEHPSSSENPSLGNMSVDMREAVKGMHAQNPPCSLSTGNVTQAGSSFNNPENTNRYSLPDRPIAAEGWKHVLTFNKKLEGSQEKSPCDQGAWLNPSSSSVAPGNPLKSESPVFMRTGLGCDIQNNKPPVAFLQVQNESTQGSTEVNDSIPANTCKGKEFEMVKCSTIPERNINSGVPHSCQIEMLSSASSPTISRVLSGTGNGNPRDNGAVDAQQLPASEGFKTIEIGDARLDKLSVQEEGNKPEPQSIPLSPPKYGTTEKWILIQQKKKFLTEKNWIAKQRKADERITKCFTQLKESVNSSEDISAKTKSVIELKKLQLLKLQCRLRSEFLNDFFKPITSDMERMKSVKKNKHGRRVKQLEKYELKMKEERMKRVRERQKEFFGELEVHREGLEECFKVKRERWRSFNRHVKEFHKRKERIHREKIDRIQREKINLLKNNDVEGYLRMVQDAKSDRVKQLLKETEKYLQKLGSKLQEAKATARRFEMEMDENRANMIEKNEIFINDEDGSDEAQHYLESNEKYYKMAHSVKESIEEQPASLQGGKLRKYQMNGLRWLVSLYNNNLNGILADEMGLGKTVQVISLICYLMEIKNDRGPFLVVVPSSVLPGWETEINFWAPSIIKIAYAGPPEERRRLFKDMIIHQKFNVLLTTYEYLMNKHDRPKLSKIHWHYIIIDEGHRIKNASCKLNADLKQYQSSHRLLLTGTPLQNNLEELWALLNFLLPSMFNSAEDFSQWFNKPFEGSGDNSPDEALLSEEENLLIINRLHQVLRPFVLRRLKHKVENELPEKIERLVRCEASAYQKLLMKRVAENLGSVGNTKIRSVHNTVMELRNICNHPYLSQLHAEEVNDLIPKHYLPPILRLCGKLEMLDRLLPKLKATNHRVLFFSTMTRLLDVMEDYLYWKRYRYLRLDGHTSGNDRGALIEEFNRPDSPAFIFLLSIRAGGVGVNLQAADTVIIFDTDWNPQVDLQAQARAHRIGQKKDVLVLRLETVDSVEEQVRASAEHKLGVANQSITAGFFDNNTSAEDRREYLESLLREHKKEETAHVLDDDALNDILARSEPEIDIFEAVDKQRREEEMATWQKLVQERVTGGRELLPLPSRLVTDEDLKPLYQAMHISESAAGVKRKGEYTGGLDSQNYGRGKRAREVRSYEDQWTEEEFEKLCQADSPESPKTQDSGKDLCHVKETYGSRNDVEITKSSEEPEKLPIITESAPKQSLLQSVLPQLPVKDNPSPAKRGRGRPKRVISDAIPVPPGSSSSITLKVEEVGTLKERLPLPSMTADASDKVKGDVVNLQQDVCEETTTGSLPSSTPVIPTVAKGRARKPKSGDRGKKQTSGSFSLAQVGIEVASTEGAVVVKNKYHGRTRAHKNAYSLHAHSSSETVSVPTALQEDLKPSATDKSQIVFEALGSDIGAARVISSSNSEHLALEQPKRQQEAMEDSILETGPPVPSAFELNSGAGGSAELNFSKSIEKDIPVEQSPQSPQLMQKIVPTLVSQLTQKSLEVITSEDVSASNSMLHTTSSSMTQEKALVPSSTDSTHSLPPTNNIGSPVIVRRTSEKKTSVTSKKAAARETKRTRASYSAVYADSQMMDVREGNGKQIDAKCSDLNSGTQMMDKHMKHVDDMTGQILLSEEGNASILAFGSSCKQSENLNDKLEFHSLVAAQRGAFTTGESGFIFQAKTSDSIEAKEVEQLKDSIVDANIVNIPSSSTESEKPKCLMDEALDYSSKLSQLTQASDIAKLALSAQVIFGEHGTAEASSSYSLVKSVVPDSIEGKEVEQFQDSIMDANVVNLPSSSTESEKPKCVMDGALVNFSKVSQLTQASDIAALSAQVIFGEHGTKEASSSHSLVKYVVSPDSIEGKEIEQLKDSIVDANVVDPLSFSTKSEKPECVMDEALDNSSKLSQLTQASDIAKTALSTQIIFGEHGIAEASLSHSLVMSVVPPDSIEGKEVEQLKDSIMDANVVNIPSSSTESEKRKCLMDKALDYSSKLSQFTQASDIAKLALSAQVIYGEHGNSIEGKEVEQLQDSIVDANVVNLPSCSTESEKSECVMDGALGNSLKVSQLTQAIDIAKQALPAQVIVGEDGTAEASSSSHSLVKSVVSPDSIEGKEVEQLKDSIMDANVVNIPSSSSESEKLKCLMDEALDYSSNLSQLTQASDIAKPALSAQVIFGEQGIAEASLLSHSLVKSVVPPDSIEGKEVEQLKDSIMYANVVNIPSSTHESEKLKCLMDKALDYSSKLSQLTQASDITKPALSAQVIFGDYGAAEASLSHSLVKSVVSPHFIEGKEVEQLKDSIVNANVVNLPSSCTESEKPECVMDGALVNSSKLSQLTQASEIAKLALSAQVIFGEHGTAEASSSYSLVKSVVPDSIEGKEVEQLQDSIMDANVVNLPSSSTESEKPKCMMDEARVNFSKVSQLTQASDIAKHALSAQVIFGEHGTKEASSSHSLVKSVVSPDSIEGKEIEQLKDSIVDANVVNPLSSSTESEKPECVMDKALDYSSKLSQLTQASDIAKPALSAQVIFGEHGAAEVSLSHSLVKFVLPSDDALNCGACDERSSPRILPTSCLSEVKTIGALLDDVDTRLTTCDVTQDELCKTVCIDVPPPKAINLRGSNSESISKVIISSNDKLKISAEDPAVGSDVTEVPQLHVSSYANDNEKSKVVIGASSTCGTLSVIFDGNGNDEIVNGQLSSLSGNLKDSSQSMRNEGELPCGEISLEQDLAVPPISGSFDLPNKKFVTAEHDTKVTISGNISSAATETISHCMTNVNSFTPKATPLFLLTETCSTHGTGGTDETVQEVKSVILDVVVVKSDYPVSHFDDNMDSSLQLLDACQKKVSSVEEEKVTDSFANILNAIRDAPLPDVSNLNEGHEKAVVSFPGVDSVDAVADNMHVDASSTYVSENPGDGLAREEEVHLGEPTVLTSLPEVSTAVAVSLASISSEYETSASNEKLADRPAMETVVSLGIAAATLLPEMIEDKVKCIESPCGINRFAAEEEKISPHSANTTMQPQSPSPVCKDSSVDLDDSSVDVNSEMCFSSSLKPDNSYFSSETDASNIAVSNVSHLSEQTKIYEGHCEFAEVSDIQQTGDDQRLSKEDSGLIFVDHINCPIGTSSESQNQKISTAAMGNVSLCAFTVAIDLSVCVLPDKRDSTSQANTTDLLLPVLEKDDRELVQIKYENEKSLSDNITVKDYSELDSSSLLTVGATGCDFVGATDCDLPDKRDSTSQANTTDILLPVLAKDDRELVELKYEKEKSLPENITEGDFSELDSPNLPAVGSTECDSPGRGNSNSLAEMLKPLSPDLTRDNEMNKLACEMKASFLKVDEMYVTDGTAVAADEAPTSTLFLSECLIENANESPLVADAPLDPNDSLVDILSVTPEPNYAIPGCALVVAKSSLHSENTCHLSERAACRHETSLATEEVSKVHTNIFSGGQEKHCISTEDNPILHVAAAGVGSVDETSSEACDCALGEQNISSITEMMSISQFQSQLAENELDDGKSDHITVSQISCPIFPSDADNSISETIYPANSPDNDPEINQKSGEGYLEPPQSFQERQVMESTEPADRTLPEESAEPVNMTQNPEVQEVNELRGLADIAHQSVQVQELKESEESAAVASQPSHTQENDGI